MASLPAAVELPAREVGYATCVFCRTVGPILMKPVRVPVGQELEADGSWHLHFVVDPDMPAPIVQACRRCQRIVELGDMRRWEP